MATAIATKTAPRTRKPKAKKPRDKKPRDKRWSSRAVIRSIEAGSFVDCASCGDRVKFQAKVRKQQVICNVYVKGRWDRVEHFHAECYEKAGSPHGEPAA